MCNVSIKNKYFVSTIENFVQYNGPSTTWILLLGRLAVSIFLRNLLISDPHKFPLFFVTVLPLPSISIWMLLFHVPVCVSLIFRQFDDSSVNVTKEVLKQCILKGLDDVFGEVIIISFAEIHHHFSTDYFFYSSPTVWYLCSNRFS